MPDLLNRLRWEDARDRREQTQLSEFALNASSHSYLEAQSLNNLRAAAALQNHSGDLGFVGRCAARELRKRGFRS